MADYLFDETGYLYTAKQVYGALKRRKITRKKINCVQIQRDEQYRREFRYRFRSRELGLFS